MELDPRQKAQLIFGGTAVVSAGVGFAAAYFWSKKQMASIIDSEVEAFKAGWEEVAAARVNARVNALANEEAKAIIQREAYAHHITTESGEEVTASDIQEAIERNVFDQPREEPEWDQEAEEATRSSEKPYVVTKDEYYTGEPGYTQMPMTYFVEDDVLIDDENDPVTDVEAAVGQDNLHKFGYGSGDGRVVYVRNDTLQMDFEITRDENSYSKTVLGFIQHDDDPRIRRFRMDRD